MSENISKLKVNGNIYNIKDSNFTVEDVRATAMELDPSVKDGEPVIKDGVIEFVKTGKDKG